MKILLLTLPRSRSNFALSSISNCYNIPNLCEPYRDLFGIPHNNDDYRAITNNLSSIENGVMKFEITQITDRHNNHKLLDLNILDLPSFDKIYTTSRTNVTDMVCSHRVALEFDRWVFQPNDTVPSVAPMKFDPSELKSVMSMRGCLRDIAVLNHIRKWMDDKNISYTDLHYETMIDYIKENWTDNKQNSFIATEYNYSQIFTNYEQIPKFIEKCNLSIPKKFSF